jgi:SOS regulatory protein LexA
MEKNSLLKREKEGYCMDVKKIKLIMKDKKITQKALAEQSGVPLQTLRKIFSGVTYAPRIDTVEAIEKALGINQPPISIPLTMGIGKGLIPLVGQVVAGIPVESEEYLEGYVTIDYPNPNEYFALRVEGDSMINARIYPNDILVVHKQNYADNGDIIVASLNGESTVKRYKVFGDSVFLMPENTAYEPIPVTISSNLYIFGKVVEIRINKL